MKRHSLLTRIWHWVNAGALIVLFMSGLNISNAHRHLYWGNYGFDPADAWLSVIRFPSWITIPQRYDLAQARDWHNLSTWVFSIALLVIWVGSLINRHLQRDIAASRREWSSRALTADIRAHLKGHFHSENSKYNSLQKISYIIVLGVFLPMMVFTGLSITAGFEAAAPWLVELFGGRQSARSFHFIFAWALFAFFVVHIVMVIVAGPAKQIGDMITGGEKQEHGNG